jgi:hypothetical protein
MLTGLKRPEGDVSGTDGDDARLTDDQRIDWLRLIRSDNVGPRGVRVAGLAARSAR